MKKNLFRWTLSSLCVVLSMCAHAQKKEHQVYLDGGYQFSNRNAYIGGLSFDLPNSWPQLNFDHYTSVFFQGILYPNSANDDQEKVYGLKVTFYWTTKYVGIGMDSRLLFQGASQRADYGPAFRVGYKYIWLEYSPNFLFYNHITRSGENQPPIQFDEVEHNLWLTARIPIFKY